MDSTQNRRNRNTEKPVPGCLGRVVNFFDLGNVVAGNRLLTDKSHFDGFGHSRRQSDAMRISPVGDALDDEVVVPELTQGSSNRNFNGTSVKMLIAEEMSKEVELKHNSPNLVAKLMGLDTLPQEKPVSVVKRKHSRSYSGSNIRTGLDSWQHEHQSLKQNRYKEFPDMTWKSHKGRYMSDETPEKVRRVEASHEKKMAFVRQKFAEAKSLSTNEKLRQSKQFQDALEVLSSNRGLFLKLLQEPVSYSQNRQDIQSASPSPKTKHITVLRPSAVLSDNPILKSGRMNVKPTKKALNAGPVNRLNQINPAISTPGCHVNENHTQPNRIVVLKPSGRPHNKNAVVSPSPPFSRELGVEMHGEHLVNGRNGRIDSREIAMGITHKIHETFSGNQREETLESTVFSDGYSGDESSFRKSENEYSSGNLSDSEIVTPTSEHTWGYMHKFGTPCGSSLSHFSFSPDSSVCREAKKRLSERWALMASNGNCQEQRHLWKSSSTLGEMLALPDTKQVVTSEEEGIIGEQETRESPLCSTSNLNIDQFVNDSRNNLLRSKSTPVNAGSSKVFVDSLNIVLDPTVGKADIAKKTTKMSTPKSSIKEKFSSLFSSRNKRSNTNKSSSTRSKHESEKPATMLVQVPEKFSDEPSKGSSAENPLRNLQGPNSSQDPVGIERKASVISPEPKFIGTKPLAPGILGENQDQPSPVSVLEPPFEEDESITTDSSNVKGDKSPPIESIARTLSWDDPSVDTATSYPLKQSRISQGSEEEEEQELLLFIKSLLLATGFDGDAAPNSLFARWYSPESPLDPALRDIYIELNAKDAMHAAKRSQSRSIGKLVFDCVNTALVEILSCDLANRRNGVHGNSLPCPPSLLIDEVWACVKGWFPYEVPKDFIGDDEDSFSLLVEAAARKEVIGNVWNEHMRLEIDNLGKDIEGILLEELTQELVIEFASRV